MNIRERTHGGQRTAARGTRVTAQRIIARTAVLSALWCAVTAAGCFDLTQPNASSPSSTGTTGPFDGTYDYSFAWTDNGTQWNVNNLPAFFIVKNGVVSSTGGELSGRVTDNFGNVTFQGPCPNGSLEGANFTGILNAGNPKFGQGTYRCNGGGFDSHMTWHVNNGH